MLCEVGRGLIFEDLLARAPGQGRVSDGQLVANLIRKTELASAARVDAVAIVAEGFRAYVEDGRDAPEQTCRLPNWTPRVKPIEGRVETTRRLGWGPDELVCLHGGNMGQKLGLDNLL
jgi:hypothetical protein